MINISSIPARWWPGRRKTLNHKTKHCINRERFGIMRQKNYWWPYAVKIIWQCSLKKNDNPIIENPAIILFRRGMGTEKTS